MGTLNPGAAIKSKLADRRIKCVFLGYGSNHAGIVYRMLNLQRKKVLITRDAWWLGAKSNKKNTPFKIEKSETHTPFEI